MRSPLAQYLTSLTATAVAFCLYWLVAVPFLEPQAMPGNPVSPFPAPANQAIEGDKSLLVSLLPENSWELAPCKILETSQGTIYFRDYQTFPDGTIEVFPFTMIIRAESLSVQNRSSAATPTEKPHRPIILRASQRASLQFDSPLILGAKSASKLQSGQLEGLVNVFQPNSAADQPDGFSLWTSNVHMSPLKIYSLDDVDFQLGPHRGSGRSFTIDLSHNTPLEAINADFSKINGIRRLELAFLKSLRIEPKSESGPPPATAVSNTPQNQVRATSSFASHSGPLDVTCSGPFLFDFDKLVASFETDVQVQRVLEPGDAIRGQKLEVRFDQEYDPQLAVNSEMERPDLSRLNLRSIHVFGEPASLRMASQQAEITAAELEYDLTREQIYARDPQQVQVIQPDQKFVARQIQYRLRDDRSLGPLIAEGPGEIVYQVQQPPETLPQQSGAQPRQLVIRWKNRLTIEPDDQQRLVTLDGGASMELDDKQQLSGERLRLWLWMQPAAATENTGRWSYLPIQAEIDGRVWVADSDFAGVTHRLTAKWPLAEQLEQQQTALFRHSEQIAGPGISSPLLPPAPQFKPQSPDAALRFASREVLVNLEQTGKLTELQSIRLAGEVQVNHWDFADPQQPPTSITGGRLHIKPLEKERYHLAIVDNARVVTADWNLTGPELHYDQQANRIWINGAGDAVVKDPDIPGQTIEIGWEAGMIFDGEKLYFEHQVAADIRQPEKDGAGHSRLQSRSAALSLILDKPVRLDEANTPRSPQKLGSTASVRQLILVNQLLADQRVFQVVKNTPSGPVPPVVLVRERFDAEQTLQLKQTLIAPHLEIMPPSEQFSASGPGQILQWQRGTPQRQPGQPALLTVSNPLQPKPMDAAATAESTITYLHVLYDGSLNAKSQPAELRLQGRVRGLYGNVPDFTTEHHPDRKQLAPGLLKLSSDDLHVVQWQRRADEQAFWELIATGSANFVGDSFEATAARMSFDERSGKLKIDGGDRGDAKLWYQAVPGSPQRDQLVAEQIAYWPETQRAEIEKVRNATINRSNNGSR